MRRQVILFLETTIQFRIFLPVTEQPDSVLSYEDIYYLIEQESGGKYSKSENSSSMVLSGCQELPHPSTFPSSICIQVIDSSAVCLMTVVWLPHIQRSQQCSQIERCQEDRGVEQQRILFLERLCLFISEGTKISQKFSQLTYTYS